MKIKRMFLLVFLVSLLTACVMQSREQTLDATMRAYEQVLRWGKIENVNQFRKNSIIFSAVAKERFKNIKVTDYELISINQADKLLYVVTVKIKYYHEQYAREKSIEDRQEWHFDEASEGWYISSALPEF